MQGQKDIGALLVARQMRIRRIGPLVEPANLYHVVWQCLDAGLPTFMEKPAGITAYQAESLCRKSEEAGQILQVGFNRRHIPLVRQVVDMVHQLRLRDGTRGITSRCVGGGIGSAELIVRR